MQDTYILSLDIHLYSIVIMLVILLINIFVIFFKQSYYKYKKYVKNITPLYCIILSFLIFTGIVLMVFENVGFSFANILMILSAFLCMFCEIKRNKKMKKTRADLTNSINDYKKYAFKIYLFELSLLITVPLLLYNRII